MDKKLYITKGLPASGKTTWAEAEKARLKEKGIACVVVCKDDIRNALTKNGWMWSPSREQDVIKVRDNTIYNAFRDGVEVVISADTNFGRHENDLRHIAKECGAALYIQDFSHIPIQTCIDRDSKRDNPVGAAVINGMYEKYILPYKFAEPYKADWAQPLAVICDLDGTLALHAGRSPFDYAKCETDEVNPQVANVIRMHANAKYTIVYMSGRENSCRHLTLRWLGKHELWFSTSQLFMRSTGDHRKDAIVKQELFDNNVRKHFNVRLVLDDRTQVVQMWRKLGLQCWQVADGDF